MPLNISENFEKLTTCNLFVGLIRQKDNRTFNYKAIRNNPNMVGISNHVVYVEIENSVDLAFRIGKLCIKDTYDMRKALPIMGNEIFYIEYNNEMTSLVTNTLNKQGFFRVIGCEESEDSTNLDPSAMYKTRHLTFFLAEYPYVDILTFNGLNTTYKWGEKGPKPISSMVEDMFSGIKKQDNIKQMGISFSADPSSDVSSDDWINYYSPSWSVLKNINFLKRLITTKNGNHSYYYLNCAEDKIKFNSIYTNYLAPNRKETMLDLIPIDFYGSAEQYKTEPNDATNTLLEVSFKYGNSIEAFFSGYSGQTFFTFDYLKGHEFNSYDYRLFKKSVSSNDKYYINYQRFGDQFSKTVYSPFTNSKINENINKYEFSKKSFNSLICEATVLINNSRALGQLAQVVLPTVSNTPGISAIDPILGSDWCVWGYKDTISHNRGVCHLTLKKDSTAVPYFGINNSMRA